MEYITRDYLDNGLEVSEGTSDPQKDEAIEAASRNFDILAQRPSGYFLDVTVFPNGVPVAVQSAVRKLAVSDIRNTDPIAIRQAGGSGTSAVKVDELVKVVAESYKPTAVDAAIQPAIDFRSARYF